MDGERTERTERRESLSSRAEELERFSRMVERESRRYPADFERRGVL